MAKERFPTCTGDKADGKLVGVLPARFGGLE
jgi:hypothetical protein